MPAFGLAQEVAALGPEFDTCLGLTVVCYDVALQGREAILFARVRRCEA